MILRTPLNHKRKFESVHEHEIPVSDRQLVPYVEQSDEMVCTYHCRQMVKSEFLAALNTTEKQVLEYKSRLEALENELCNSEQERQKYQDHLHYVEQELQASKGREHALQEQLLKEITDYQERYHTQLKRCSELELQLKKEVKVRKSVELLAEAAKEKASAVEKELLLVSESNEREKNRLHLSFLHLQDESKLSLSRANAELERMRTRADCFEKEAELLRKSLGDLKEQLNKETELHESHMNKELLREQLLEEKGRREKAEMELNRLQEIQVHAQKFESELTSWKSLLNQIPDVSCYDDIPKKYAQLQKESIENMLKVDVANARLKELQVTLETVNLSKEHAEKECRLEQKKAECLSLEVKRLELMLGHGDYSTTNTKVLRMVNSLGIDNEAKRTIEVLRADLQKTKAKLQAIEELCGQSDVGNAINVDIAEKLSQLKEQIATLEKREERYKAVFAEKISVFRRACCSLFGYKIVMDDQQRPNGIPVTRFTLQSIYAQNDEEKLEFEYESGNATILDNDYTSQMEIHHQVDIFVRKMNSIPAFTANLTVESFNKRTLS